MNTFNLLDDVGQVCNKSKCIYEMRKRVSSFTEMKEIKIANLINTHYSQNFRFFTDSYEEVTERDFRYVWIWVFSGFNDNCGQPIYFQFRETNSVVKGAMVGTAEEIVQYQSESDGIQYDTSQFFSSYEEDLKNVEGVSFIPDTEEDKQPTEVKSDTVKKPVAEAPKNPIVNRNSLDCTKTSDFYQELYDKLLIQEDWDLSTNNLRNYIDTTICRINYILSEGLDYSDFFAFNSDKSLLVFNSGLLDKFGKSILILTQILPSFVASFTNIEIVKSKTILASKGFDKSAVGETLDRVSFYNTDSSELFFNADLSDIDLDDWDRLTHCIEERRSRYPKKFIDMPSEFLCNDIVRAVELGIQLNKADSGYIKPFYNRKGNEIQYIIPYHVGSNLLTKPELGIVIAKGNHGYWQVRTVLEADDCKRNIMVMSPYQNHSF